MNLLNNTQSLLKAANVTEKETSQIPTPLYERIELNYWHPAKHLLKHALSVEMTKATNLVTSPEIQDRQMFPARLDEVKQDSGKLDHISYQEFQKDRSLGVLAAFGRSSRSLTDATETLTTLEDLSLDLEYFRAC